MANPSVSYTFTNGSSADGTKVSQNFSDLVAAMTDGTKDFTIANLTANGNVVLGSNTSDTITWNGLGTAVKLDNGATDSGAIYFDGGTTAYLKGNAAGTTLSTGGFTDFDHASVKARYTSNAGNSYGTGPTIVDYEDLVIDSHSAVTTGAAWKFTAPITGIYYVSAGLVFNAAAYSLDDAVALDIYVNAALYARIAQVNAQAGATVAMGVYGSAFVAATAAQTIDIRVSNARGSTAIGTTAARTYVAIIKLSQ